MQRFVDLLDQLALTITGAQFQAELFFLAGAIRRIGEVGRVVLHVMHGPVDFLHQFQLPLVEDAGEVGAHRLTHVLLALGFLIGFKATNQLTAFCFCFGGHG
ncbi:hypothetical protein D9M68_792910 [compost metagenome]